MMSPGASSILRMKDLVSMDILHTRRLLGLIQRPDRVWRKIPDGPFPRREGYIIAFVVLGALVYQGRQILLIKENLGLVGEMTFDLLEEAYQNDVDEVFEHIVETALDDLDDP